MPLTNCKVELKFKWRKFCILPRSSTENFVSNDDNANNIIFIIKKINLYVPAVTLSSRDNQVLSKNLSKGSERSVIALK